MLVTDSYTASVCIAVTVLLFILIQVFSPPKPWGDVSHNVTYHFVRKYLLRLDERKGHVKYWRPQILLLANDPRKEWNLIIFCNSLKKGALYILGHVLQGQFHDCLPELRQTHLEWLKLVDVSGVKGFVDVVIARDVREGARNLILSCGLGGMRPNIIVLGFPTALQRASEHRRGPVARVRPSEPPSVRSTYTQPIDGTKYVGILEDALALNKALAVAYGFDAMDLPGPSKVARYEPALGEQYIDLWPIQMATHVRDEAPSWDTYTMVLQLGTILSFTGTWRQHKLRVNVFVEHVDEIASERLRVRTLLDNLRIPASLRVFCLSGHVPRYDAIVLGKRALDSELTEVLQDDPWWKQVCDMRRREELQKQMKHKAEPIDAGARRGSPSLPSIDGRRRACQSRQMGVSLPEEHLAYHYNNIRLGLSHPDAHDRQDDDSDYASFQLDAENTYDELESELASLAVDWDPAYLIRARRAKQQQREAQSDGPYGVSYGTLSSSQRTVTPATVHTQDARPRRRTEVHSPHTSPRSAPETAPLVPAMTRGGRALTFNDLPNHAQYLILNELIRRYSTRSTSVVLTALPAPAPGTSTSERDSLAYLHQLQSLYSGGPPVLGVHATTLTMTMTL